MFWDYLYNGLGLGAIFAFIALGYTMVYGIIKLINFAHGEFFMLGAYAGFFVLSDLGIERLHIPQPFPILLSYFVALTAASLASGAIAVIAERIAYRPVRFASRITALITAVCVSLMLQNLAIKAFGASPRAYPNPKIWVSAKDLPSGKAAHNYYAFTSFKTAGGGTAKESTRVIESGQRIDAAKRAALVAGGHVRVYRELTLGVTTTRGFVLLALALWTPVLWFLVKKTRMGKAMRAVSEDPDAAQLMGISIDKVVTFTFLLGGVVAGVGGVAYCATYGKVEPLTGFLPGLKAFIAAVIGGIGSIPGAIVGGLVLGVAESVLPYFAQQLGWQDAFAWKDAISFAILILVLVVKPTGLLGKKTRVKV